MSSSEQLPGSAPRKQQALGLFAGLPSGYDRMGALLSFGQDPRWRAALVNAISACVERRDTAKGSKQAPDPFTRDRSSSVANVSDERGNRPTVQVAAVNDRSLIGQPGFAVFEKDVRYPFWLAAALMLGVTGLTWRQKESPSAPDAVPEQA